MPCESVVRIARPEDHQEVWRLLLAGHRENGLFALAPDKVEWFVGRALAPEKIPPGDTATRGVIGVIGQVGALEALVLVMIGTYWYSHDKHLEEFIVYVDPECRHSNHAKALVQWMKDQSEQIGLPLVSGIISTHRTEAKCRLYKRMLPKVGEFFVMFPKGGAVAAPALIATSS